MASDNARPVPVAIIGMGCLFPKADSTSRYWANVRDGIDAITEVPASHWKIDDYFDADPKAPDRTYARRGGFLDPVDFAPLDFGLSPNTLEATDATQLLGLVAARQAMIDAGYGPGATFDRSRVSVLLGVTGTLELVIPLAARLGHPLWKRALADAGVDGETADDVVRRISEGYVGWQEDSFPGLLGNVVAGRISNRLDLKGTNCVVDAACASSLGAVHLAMLELTSGRSDMVLTGGMDTFNDIFMYMCFSKTPALSPTGDARPFAASGDGTILGEGLGCLVLKRLDDAERDGDRIYAVIRSVGSSSDGKGHAIYAPSSEGQVRALKEAYRLADVTPDSIELVEAHGTGTLAGDAAEAAALVEVYGSAAKDSESSWCALGSVKSQIGHTKAAAGAAGLMKAALALHNKVLPPTIKVNRPIESLLPGRSPFYVNTEKRPWLPSTDHPRRAAVSAFGFGGSNFHCVLEEYRPEKEEIDWDGDVEVVAFSADSPASLEASLAAWPANLDWEGVRREASRTRQEFDLTQEHRLVIVAERRKGQVDRLIAEARAVPERYKGQKSASSPEGIYYGTGRALGDLALLFPGQGAQYPGMFRDIACRFPEMQRALAAADAAFSEDNADESPKRRLSDYIYPQPSFQADSRKVDELALRATEIAQPALGAVALGVVTILDHFGVKPAAVAGHSYGELPSLCAAGRFDSKTLHRLSRLRGRSMAEGSGDRGAMLAVLAPREAIDTVLGEDGLTLVVANKNAPRQSVLSGASSEIARAREAFKKREIEAISLSVSAAFHSPFVADAERRFSAALADVEIQDGAIPVYANTTGKVYPDDAGEARSLLAGQLAQPVEFVSLVENMYETGFRTFLEVGPSNKLTGLVGAILKGQPHSAFSVDAAGGSRDGLIDLARTLAQLAALGHEVDLVRWEGGPAIATPRIDKKPTLTIPLCGANYVKPKVSTEPTSLRTKSAAPSSSSRVMPDTEYASRSNGTHAKPSPSNNGHGASHGTANGNGNGNGTSHGHAALSNGHAAASAVAPVHHPVAASPVVRPATPPPLPLPSQPAPQVARTSVPNHDALIALQELGEQTARLHRQFLEGQDRALQVFQTLLSQPPAPVYAAPAPQVAPPAPTMTQAREAPVAQPVARVAPVAAPAPLPVAPTPEPAPVAVSKPVSSPAPAPSQVAPTTTPSSLKAESTLLAVVAEKTGYPAEMLELSMEIEADLGIDSIKRVEIFSALQDRLPEAPPIKAEHLGTLRTLKQVVDFIAGPSISQTNAPVQVVAQAQAAASVSSGKAESTLLAVVAEKTGYPAEMLELSMEIEADLGIDSIKRVEIFSALQDRLPEAPPIKAEHLGTLRTLKQVIEFLAGSGAEAEARPMPVESRNGTHQAAPTPTSSTGISRYAVVPKLFDPAGRVAATLQKGGEVWITDDASGLAQAISAQFGSLGFRPRVVGWNEVATLAPANQLAALVILATQPGPDDDATLRQSLRLVQLAGPGLRTSGKLGGSAFVTVTQQDGRFGLGGEATAKSATLGGLAGLSKTAGHEWNEVRCRALDLAPSLTDHTATARLILDELQLTGPSEVGLASDGRWTLELVKTDVDGTRAFRRLRRNDVVVVTGGARGVTAEVAVALAQDVAPTLVLLGRSPEPKAEPSWLAPLKDEAEIKRALLGRSGGGTSPKEIEAEFRKINGNREALRNIERIKAAGAKPVYRQLDVRNGQALTDTLASITQEFGPIRGLVHGAGVLADALIEAKTLDSFDLVYQTKVIGLRAMLGAIPVDSLKVLVLFSSSTGRFGRTGQVDYAIANEVLNKLGGAEARRRPDCKVVSVNWGPWDGGMVTPALKKLFASEGVGLIPTDAGAAYLVNEISSSASSVEVVILGGEGQPEPEPRPTKDSNATKPASVPMTTAFEREVSLESVPVLRSHIIDGRGVLPMAITLEWLSHAAMHGNPDLVFHGVEGLRINRGVFVDAGKSLTLKVQAGKATRRDGQFVVPTQLVGQSDGHDMIHARADVILANNLPKSPQANSPLSLKPFARSRDAIYREILFHGAALHAIEKVEGCSEQGITATVASAPAPADWIVGPPRGSWLADPLVLDAAFQMLIVWSFERRGEGSLPCFLGQYRQFTRALPKSGLRIAARITRDTPHLATADIEILDSSCEVVASLTGYECVIDASLNQAFRRNQVSR